MKIFIDFDDVIFNTELLKKRLGKIFLKNGVSRELFKESYQQLKKREKIYSPVKHLEFLVKHSHIDSRKVLIDLKKLMKNLKPHVFNEARTFLKHFPRNSLYLLSYGDLRFQRQKIKTAGVSKYFKRILITNDDKLKIIKKIVVGDNFGKKEKIVFIDDNPRHVKEVRKKGIITFQIIKPHSKLPRVADFSVKNFKEIEKILNG